METIAVASDHAGYEMKNAVIEHLKSKGYSISDFGCYSDESCDYPDYAHPLAQAMERGEYKRAVVFCGSGNGINMTVNKYPGIRSSICWNKELAILARQNNPLANTIRFTISFSPAVLVKETKSGEKEK